MTTAAYLAPVDRLPPAWRPSSESEIAAAAAAGLLEEGHHLDIKRELGAGRAANKEAAKDMASFAVDGGLLLYGVDEATTPPSLSPQPTAGVAERLEQIALMAVAEPLHITTTVVPSSQQPDHGYILVSVPPSGRAPHMVEGRYYGRGDKTKIALSDAQVLALHERRLMRQKGALAEARAYLNDAPVPSSEGLVVALALPVAASTPILQVLLGQDGWHERLLSIIGRVSGPAAYAPALRQATTVSRRPRGAALTAGLDPYRRVEESGRPERARKRVVEVVFGDDGSSRVLSARATDEDKGYKLIFDKLVAGVAGNIVDLAVDVARLTEYQGAWEFALVADGLRDGTSWALDEHHTSGHPFTDDSYEAGTTASRVELEVAPGPVAGRLVAPLLRALGSEHLPVFADLRRTPDEPASF